MFRRASVFSLILGLAHRTRGLVVSIRAVDIHSCIPNLKVELLTSFGDVPNFGYPLLTTRKVQIVATAPARFSQHHALTGERGYLSTFLQIRVSCGWSPDATRCRGSSLARRLETLAHPHTQETAATRCARHCNRNLPQSTRC